MSDVLAAERGGADAFRGFGHLPYLDPQPSHRLFDLVLARRPGARCSRSNIFQLPLPNAACVSCEIPSRGAFPHDHATREFIVGEIAMQGAEGLSRRLRTAAFLLNRRCQERGPPRGSVHLIPRRLLVMDEQVRPQTWRAWRSWRLGGS